MGLEFKGAPSLSPSLWGKIVHLSHLLILWVASKIIPDFSPNNKDNPQSYEVNIWVAPREVGTSRFSVLFACYKKEKEPEFIHPHVLMSQQVAGAVNTASLKHLFATCAVPL